jgi:hypothetical protein
VADLDVLLHYFTALPDFESARRGDDFWYASVPLCVLDAVFSINARYEGVRAVVLRYCENFGAPMERARDVLPTPEEQTTVSQLVEQISTVGADRFADEVVHNRARTSTVNGILKVEACLQFAEVLRQHKVEVLQDLVGRDADQELVTDLEGVKGQSSGVAVRYFFMLAGAEHLVKPDRMILRFLSRLLGRAVVDGNDAQALLSAVAVELQREYPEVTAQSLDYAIWSRERVRPASYA